MARKLVVEIVGDASSLERAFRRADRSAQTFSKRMTGVGSSLLKGGVFAAATAGVVGFTAALKVGFDEMLEGQAATADTAAVLKSTGAIAGVTAKQVEQLGTSLQQLTGYDDEAIRSAENLVLTFTNVRNVVGEGNDIFDQAIRSTLDLSRRFDQDLSTSAVQLGKALNDPVRGVTALRRAGVSFTAAQARTIKRLVDTGRLLEAQKVLLAEVRVETGGAAAAYGKTLPGQLDILRGSLSNLAGDIAETLGPEVKKLTERFNKWLADPENKKEIIEGFGTATHVLGEAFQFAADGAGLLKEAWDKLPDFGKDKGLLDYLKKIPGADKSIIDLIREGHVPALRGMRPLLGGAPGAVSHVRPELRVPAVPGWAAREGGGAAAAIAGGAAPPGTDLVKAATGKTPAELRKQANQWFDAMIGRKIDRVQDINSLRGQVAALGTIAGLVRDRLAITKDITRRLNLEDELVDIGRLQKAVREQIKANQLDAKQAALAREQAQLAAKRARHKAEQFRALGLTATGEERAPSAKALAARFSVLSKAVKGTVLDTTKVRTLMEGVRKVFAGKWDEIGRDVKLAIKGILDEWNDQLKANQTKLIQGRKTSVRAILRSAGLSPDEVKRVSGALSQVGRTGRVPGGGFGAFGTIAGAGTIVVQHTTLLDGKVVARSTTKHQQKGRRRNPEQKRGPFAGGRIQ